LPTLRIVPRAILPAFDLDPPDPRPIPPALMAPANAARLFAYLFNFDAADFQTAYLALDGTPHGFESTIALINVAGINDLPWPRELYAIRNGSSTPSKVIAVLELVDDVAAPRLPGTARIIARKVTVNGGIGTGGQKIWDDNRLRRWLYLQPLSASFFISEDDTADPIEKLFNLGSISGRNPLIFPWGFAPWNAAYAWTQAPPAELNVMEIIE